MKPKYDEPLSNFASKFNLCHYSVAKMCAAGKLAADDEDVRVILAALEQRVVLVAPDMKPQARGGYREQALDRRRISSFTVRVRMTLHTEGKWRVML